MGNFKVGDRVRVNCPISIRDGHEGTITALYVLGSHRGVNYIGHRVDMGSPNKSSLTGEHIFEPHELEPLTPPHQKQLTAEDVLSLEGLPDFKIPVRVAA